LKRSIKVVIRWLYIAFASSELTLSELIRYPFLPRAREYVASLGLDFETIPKLQEIRDRAKQRVSSTFMVESALSQEPSPIYEIEIASYALSILYVAGIKDPALIERFALFEAKKVNEHLRKEQKSETILDIAKAFNWEVKKNEDGSIFIHFTKFLEASTKGRLHHDSVWKLVNRIMERGWVSLTPFQLARLLEEDVKKHIEESAKQELGKVPEQIQQDIDELKAEFLKRKPQFEEVFEVIRAQESDYPPCITAMMKRTSQGQHLSHVERFTLVTYLLRQRISVDTIVSLFSNVPDFKEDKTRYQVEHLSGARMGKEPYMPYNCASLQTHGICSGSADPICRTIRNPLSYHLRKKGFQKIWER
jgi:DNA primase large subunit